MTLGSLSRARAAVIGAALLLVAALLAGLPSSAAAAVGDGPAVRVEFDDAYLAEPAGHHGYHGFTVFNALGEPVTATSVHWSAWVDGVNGHRDFNGWTSGGRAVFDYTATDVGLDVLTVHLHVIDADGDLVDSYLAEGTALRSYGGLLPDAMSTLSVTELCGNALLSSQVGYNVVQGTEADDQLWGTAGADIIYGHAGEDDIKAWGGGDILCGGPGHDGLNGGDGNDFADGGEGRDLVVVGGGSDYVWGGPGTDGLFGGAGSDTITGGMVAASFGSPTVAADDDAADYVIGGPDNDRVDLASGMVPGSDDEIYQDTQPAGSSSCPGAEYSPTPGAEPVLHAKDPTGFLPKIGVFRPDRLAIVDRAEPCITIKGRVTKTRPAGDGDLHIQAQGQEITVEIIEAITPPGIDISILPQLAPQQEIVLEFMPRDKLNFTTVPPDGSIIQARGLFVKDFCHGALDCDDPDVEEFHLELHPVYWIKIGTGSRVWSGPSFAGSPVNMRPDWIGATQSDGPGVTYTPNGPNGTKYRYCWYATGAECGQYGAGGAPFQ